MVTHLLLLLAVVLVILLVRATLRLRRFKSDRGEIWHDCSSSKYISIYLRESDF